MGSTKALSIVPHRVLFLSSRLHLLTNFVRGHSRLYSYANCNSQTDPPSCFEFSHTPDGDPRPCSAPTWLFHLRCLNSNQPSSSTPARRLSCGWRASSQSASGGAENQAAKQRSGITTMGATLANVKRNTGYFGRSERAACYLARQARKSTRTHGIAGAMAWRRPRVRPAARPHLRRVRPPPSRAGETRVARDRWAAICLRTQRQSCGRVRQVASRSRGR